MWQVWLVLAVIFLIFEMVIPTDFLMFWVGIGAGIACLTSLVTDNLTIQIAVFCISSIALFFCTKPFIRQILKKDQEVVTNALSIIGKEGIVTIEINGMEGQGQIMVDHEKWSAKPSAKSVIIPVGSIVKVEAIDGVKAVVVQTEEAIK